MEAASLAFSVAQTLFAALQSSELKQLFSMWGYQSELENLESTVKTIKAVLLSANSKHALTPEEWDLIDNLKDVLYEADDLIDEFVTTVALQQQHQSLGKVRSLFRRFKKLGFAYKTSEKVKILRKKMDRVADDANKFSFKIDDQKRREETCSYVNVNEIIGRDDDQRKIVDMLVDPNNSQNDVSVITIVGIGGLGKTALAQLVYNDPMLQQKFPVRLWICVSDQDQKQFDVKPILDSILKSTGERHIDDLNFEQLVDKLREKLVESSPYLLVLDDVWTENHGDWLKLKSYLLGSSQRGNKILVTTRSEGTAVAVGSSHTYKLQGLSDESSWCLFEMVAGYERANSPDLVEMGRDIVKKCANVPLAIKVVGSLLYGQERNIWLSFQKTRLSEIRKDKSDIMSILEFSYIHLSPSLKSCFTYCALFPKDFEFEKEKLLDLWMTQDYVEPLDEGQNCEDAAQEYFQILARRCFFQDLENNEFQEVVRFKIHDLMHDMAQQVARKEISIAHSTTSTLDKRIRHLYDDAPHSRTQGFMVGSQIRTFLTKYGDHGSQFPVCTLLENWRSLRTLDLRHMGLRSLPDTIGQLLHLRYLDLSKNSKLKMLPKSLTKLINLQFLNVKGCNNLKELPKDLRKIVNLRTLYVPKELEYMPVGLGRMTRLTRLNYFIVGEKKSCLKLEELGALRNLKGFLDIRVSGKYEHAKDHCGKGEYICHIEHLNSISINWGFNRTNEEVRLCNDEEVLEDLQPHTNLKALQLWNYGGVRMGGWGREDSLTTSLPNLVQIYLLECLELKELPWLARLQHLKTLSLSRLKNVEYMESRRSIGSNVASNSSTILESSSSSISFFPSLEFLHLYDMPKLKGWWGVMCNCTSGLGSWLGMGKDEIVSSDSSMLTPPAHLLPWFPRLSELNIAGCSNLTSFPLCPCVETLKLRDLNERFETIIEEGEEMGVGSSSNSYDSGKIREIETSSSYVKSLPMGAFECLVTMTINHDEKLKSVSEVEDVFRSCSSSLRSLTLDSCRKLRSVCEGGGLEYLTGLQQLELISLRELRFEETDMPWRILGQCLRTLKLCGLSEVVSLPKGMRYLTSLQSLVIWDLQLKEIPEWIECLSSLQSLQMHYCNSLESLPREMKNLTSLKEFRLVNCSEELKRRCKKPDGEYWPILEHIPTLTIR